MIYKYKYLYKYYLYSVCSYLNVGVHFVTCQFLFFKFAQFGFQVHQCNPQFFLQNVSFSVRWGNTIKDQSGNIWKDSMCTLVSGWVNCDPKQCLTLLSSAASLMGTHWCFLWSFASLQITQIGFWWSTQNNLSLSPWVSQRSSVVWRDAFSLSDASSLRDSVTFFSATLRGGRSKEDISLQTGHVLLPFCVHHSWMQFLQKLCPHSRMTGSL